jgi:hypothetical protein
LLASFWIRVFLVSIFASRFSFFTDSFSLLYFCS